MSGKGGGLDPFGIVPKRSATKATVLNKLDSTVAGVIRSEERPVDCMARKIAVEASIAEEYTRANIVACGTVSYQMLITSKGMPGCQHIISYLYEMEIDRNMIPRPGNDEVDAFTLMTLDDVKGAMVQGEFVANRAMIWLAYLIRHGVVTAENEPDFIEICQRLQRKHDLFILEG
ncbi:hypothetical protein F4778DRAFT_788721 [Xylariomycetidae sp. FL2044]|nr:hypothetical protein F4778DRAFT_788721 [Xylariomycetidae sp. FL2044]